MTIVSRTRHDENTLQGYFITTLPLGNLRQETCIGVTITVTFPNLFWFVCCFLCVSEHLVI